MVVLAMVNVCAVALIDFPSSLSFKIACILTDLDVNTCK